MTQAVKDISPAMKGKGTPDRLPKCRAEYHSEFSDKTYYCEKEPGHAGYHFSSYGARWPQ